MYINRDNVKIHYDYIKSIHNDVTDTLVMIHGVGLDMHSWEYIIPYLQNEYHILLYDIRGHGTSGLGNTKLSIPLLAGDLKYLIEYLNIDSLHLIAQGYGGMIAVHLVSQSYENIKSLVLMSVPLIFPKTMVNNEILKRQELVKGENNMSSLGSYMIKKIILDIDERKKEILMSAYKKVKSDVYFTLFDVVNLPITANQFKNIQHPILLLSGAEDEIYPTEITIASLNFNPRARYLIVPEASFLIQMDQPQITANWIKQFYHKVNKNSYLFEPSSYTYKQDLTEQIYSEIQGFIKGKVISNEPAKKNEPEIIIEVLNGFRVFINGKQIIEGWGKRKAKPLFMYLVLQQSITRDEICDVLWPDIDIKNARNRLRVALHHLKKILGEEQAAILVTERENIYLKGNIICDLLGMFKDMKRYQEMEDLDLKVESLTKFLSKIPDNPLPGLYDEWFLNLRNQIESEWGDMAIFLKDYFLNKQDFRKALYYFEKALKFYNEDAQLLGDYSNLKETYKRS